MKKLLILLIHVSVMPEFNLCQSTKCEMTELQEKYPTFLLKAFYRIEMGKYYNEPKSPFDASLQDRLFGNLECGRPVTDVTKAIVNGRDAPAKAWPWQALLISLETPTESTSCGGALISKSWVLTAAHCITSDNITVLLGERTRANSQLFKASKSIVHEEYHHPSSGDDLALIKLDRDVVFNDYVKPVCLPRYGTSQPSDELCYTTGYGKRSFLSPDTSPKLQQIKVYIMPQSFCAYSYNVFHGSFPLDNRRLCMDLSDYNQTTCHGDSGGPLSCKINGRFQIVGTVSYGYSNCTSTLSSEIFMRVSEYLDWIVTNIASTDLK